MRSPRLPLLVLLLLLAPWSGFAKEVPFLTGRVNDSANLLTPEQRQRIEAKLAGLEQRTTIQVAVLTVNSLEGDPIEDFSIRVVETWKLGEKGEDNGALLLVSRDDRKMRIEVGYGLEPVLTDLRTSVIQNDVIIPYFRRGDFGGGIEAGVDAIVSTVEGKAVQPATPQEPRRGGEGRSGWSPGFLLFMLFLLFPFSMDAIRSRSWFMYLFLMPFYFFLGSILSPIVGMIAAGAWMVGFPILRMIMPKQPQRLRRRGGGGWFIGPGMGGWGGGGGGGWSGGGGGFSGGGGSFGGGGSSSSW